MGSQYTGLQAYFAEIIPVSLLPLINHKHVRFAQISTVTEAL